MIEQLKIDGQDAIVSYLTSEFEPADKDSADLIKVWLPDKVMILVAKRGEADVGEEQASDTGGLVRGAAR